VTPATSASHHVPVFNLIRFPDRNPTEFRNSEPDPYRTGFRKNLNRIRYGYPNCVDHCSNILNQSFFLYKPDWIKYLDRSTGLGSDRITQWKFWTGLGLQNIQFVQLYHVRMHRVIFYIPNTLIKLIIRALEFVFR